MEFSYAPSVRLVDASDSEFNSPSDPRWYLAYGSNLSAIALLERRGISPLAKEVMLVKGLELVFDAPGVPFIEPRFANCRLSSSPSCNLDEGSDWTGIGSLLGVGYLLSAADFRKVIATEGGGTSYQPLLVDAHTVTPDGIVSAKTKSVYTLQTKNTRTSRGQASLRYMKLIRNGARASEMPEPYIRYLDGLPHYRAAHVGQRVGKIVYMVTWLPGLLLFFRAVALLSDRDGNVSPWLRKTRVGLFWVMWGTYDWIGRHLFGSAEEAD